tara:strand:+ start:229 stop:1023 length:795 start_codon:yes stop_codon:yes gene_type:complete
MKNQKFPIFLINLKKNTDRLIYSLNELSKVDLNEYITRKEACDVDRAKKLKYEFISEKVEDNIDKELLSCEVLPTWGAVGCAISHLEIWKMIVDDNIKFALILEDDNEVYDIDKFKWCYYDALKKMRKSEYISYFISFCSETNKNERTYIGENLYSPKGHFIGSSFYFISFCAAKDLLKKLSSITLQLDLEISNVFLYKNNLDKLKIQIYDKSGVRQNESFPSNVQFYFWEIEDLYNFFKIPLEIAEKIYFFLPKKHLIEPYYN